MTVYESDLPGVGKKFEIDLDDGSRLVVVTHNTGKREVFRRESADADSQKLFEVNDQLARRIGTILEGAYFQPVKSDNIETLLAGDTLIEWVDVPEGSAVAGKTLVESDIRQRTGANVIAIQRGNETIANPDPHTRIEVGDTLLTIGNREDCTTFVDYVKDD